MTTLRKLAITTLVAITLPAIAQTPAAPAAPQASAP